MLEPARALIGRRRKTNSKVKLKYNSLFASVLLGGFPVHAAQVMSESHPFGLNLDGRPSILEIAPVDYVVWLAEFFTMEDLFNVELVAEEGDADSDGKSNRFEYLAALDPTNGEENFRILIDSGDSPSVLISPFKDGVNFQIQKSRDLVNWTSLDANAFERIGESVRLLLDTVDADDFYRVQLLNRVPSF